MANSLQGLTLWAANANEDLSNYLYHFIKVDDDGGLLHAGVSSRPLGICIETATLNYPASVQCDGIGKVVLGADCDAGTEVMPDATGAAVPAVGSPPGVAAGLLLTGGETGDIVSVRLLT